MLTCSLNNRPSRHRRRGFTLGEVLMASLIISLVFSAVISLVATSYSLSALSVNHSIAVMLAQETREWTINLPFEDPDTIGQGIPVGPDSSPDGYVDDLDDVMDWTYSPPRSAQPQTLDNKNMVPEEISSLAGWSQKIEMVWLDPEDLSVQVADGASDIIRVTVTVNNGDEDIFESSWLIIRPGASSS